MNAFFLVVALASGRMTSSDSFVEYMVAMIFPTRAVNILKAWCVILGRNSEDLVRQKLFYIIRGRKCCYILHSLKTHTCYFLLLLILSRCIYNCCNAFFAEQLGKLLKS